MSNEKTFANFHELGGVLHSVKNTESKGKKKNFYIREFFLEVKNTFDGQTYTETPKFILKKDKVSLIDSFEKGDPIVVHFRVSGRFWESPDKGMINFTELVAFKITRMADGVVNDMQADNKVVANTSAFEELPAEEENQGLPF